MSARWYLRHFMRQGWIRSFLFAKTAPLATPAYFRGFPETTGRECTHCLSCQMICPAPGAIAVVRNGEGWRPAIERGHCIRCGLCVELCPEGVLAAGRILDAQQEDHTAYRARFRLHVDQVRCMRCGNCVVSCPVNKELDPGIGSGGYSGNDEVIMRIEGREHRILHEEKTTGCRTCENACPNQAIRIERIVEAVHGEKKPCR